MSAKEEPEGVSKDQEVVEEKKEDATQSVPPKESIEDEKLSRHNALCHDMFQKITEYLNGELAGIRVSELSVNAAYVYVCLSKL